MLIDLCKLCIHNMYAFLYGEYVSIADSSVFYNWTFLLFFLSRFLKCISKVVA
jgi:hypothetical protein